MIGRLIVAALTTCSLLLSVFMLFVWCVSLLGSPKMFLPLWTNSSCPWSMCAWVKLSTSFMGALFRARCPLLGGVTMKCSSCGGESRSCALRSSGLISVTEDTQTWTQDGWGQNRCNLKSTWQYRPPGRREQRCFVWHDSRCYLTAKCEFDIYLDRWKGLPSQFVDITACFHL